MMENELLCIFFLGQEEGLKGQEVIAEGKAVLQIIPS